ncbi:hypothetical protein AALD01_03300 [Oscillospiraceae bacterium 21-37]
METELNLNGYQVARRELFAHTREPAAVFSRCCFYVNAACLDIFPEHDTVQVMICREKHLLALCPCPAGQRDALLWCLRAGKRRPRRMTCRLFFAMVCSMMGWDPGLRYRALGRVVQDSTQKAILFDLNCAETYGSGSRNTPQYPADWRERFGPDYRAHQALMATDLVKDYAVYQVGGEPGLIPALPQKEDGTE